MRVTGGGGRDADRFSAGGRSRGGLTTKNHLVCGGKGRVLAFVLTSGQTAETSMLAPTLDQIRVPVARGRPRTRPDRVLADKGYPSRANRAWLRQHGIAATIPGRADKTARNDHAGLCLAASLHWFTSTL